MPGLVLEVRNLNISPGPFAPPLVSGLNFQIHSGEMLLVDGVNGSGKSTLLKTLLGLHPASLYDGTVRWSVPKQKIAYLPQLDNTHCHLPATLRDIIHYNGEREVQDTEILKFGLLTTPQLDRPWNTASGGERKRTLLLRALVESPRCLVLDEPLNHLDTTSRELILQTLREFLAEKTNSIILVSHQGISQDADILNCTKRLLIGGGVVSE